MTGGTPRRCMPPAPPVCWLTCDGRAAAKMADWPRRNLIRGGLASPTSPSTCPRRTSGRSPTPSPTRSRWPTGSTWSSSPTRCSPTSANATRDVRGRRGRKKDPQWAARRRLLTGYKRLTRETFARLWNALLDAGDPGLEILHAYTVKENLRLLLALADTHPDREVISHGLWRFYDQAASSTSPEVPWLAATIEAWWPAVEAAITTGYFNALSEGYNHLAKHQGRNAFGFRNVHKQRRRIRWTCTRQHRRATATTTQKPAQVRNSQDLVCHERWRSR